MDHKLQLDFQLLGTQVSPKDISQRISISPDVELSEGERNRKLNLPRWNIWSIRSHVQSDEVADHWRELEKLLIEALGDIKEIAETGTARITIIVNSDHRIPSIMIPSSMSKFAGEINATIDIDHLQ